MPHNPGLSYLVMRGTNEQNVLLNQIACVSYGTCGCFAKSLVAIVYLTLKKEREATLCQPEVFNVIQSGRSKNHTLFLHGIKQLVQATSLVIIWIKTTVVQSIFSN